MATSGTYSVDFNIVDIIGEAWERVGGNVTTGNEYLSARRSIDLLFRDLLMAPGSRIPPGPRLKAHLVAGLAGARLDRLGLELPDYSALAAVSGTSA